MAKYQTSANFKFRTGEKFSQPSQTVNNNCYSIQEILKRFANGMELDVLYTPHYEEDADFNSQDLRKLHNMDLADRDNFLIKLKAQKATLSQSVKKNEQDIIDYHKQQTKLAKDKQQQEKDFKDYQKKQKEPRDTQTSV